MADSVFFPVDTNDLNIRPSDLCASADGIFANKSIYVLDGTEDKKPDESKNVDTFLKYGLGAVCAGLSVYWFYKVMS